MTALRNKVIALGLAGAVALTMHFEGLRYVTYKDPIGIYTDCYGHTGPDVKPGARNTLAQCNAKLDADLLEANATVDSCTTVPLNQNQRSAFVDFAFNVGPGKAGRKDGFCVLKNGNRPSFLRKLNSGDYTGACTGLGAWVNAGGKPLNGLIRRRGADVALCLKAVS